MIRQPGFTEKGLLEASVVNLIGRHHTPSFIQKAVNYHKRQMHNGHISPFYSQQEGEGFPHLQVRETLPVVLVGVARCRHVHAGRTCIPVQQPSLHPVWKPNPAVHHEDDPPILLARIWGVVNQPPKCILRRVLVIAAEGPLMVSETFGTQTMVVIASTLLS